MGRSQRSLFLSVLVYNLQANLAKPLVELAEIEVELQVQYLIFGVFDSAMDIDVVMIFGAEVVLKNAILAEEALVEEALVEAFVIVIAADIVFVKSPILAIVVHVQAALIAADIAAEKALINVVAEFALIIE